MTIKRSLILLAALVLVLTALLNLPKLSSSKTWEITLSFNTQTQSLSLKRISTLSQTFRPDYRGAQDSAYQLLVVDKNQKPLYLTRINITEALFFSPQSDYYQLAATAAASPKENLQSSLDTTIYIPYFKDADKIIIEKSGKTVLVIKLKTNNRLLNFDFINLSFAQTSSSTGPLQVVFISDGYTNQQQFSSDVASLKAVFASTPPYSSSPNMFQFQEAYNTNALGCVQSFSCINNPQIRSIGLSKNPQAAKFIVLVRGSSEPGLGLTNDVGGDTVLLKTDVPIFTHVGVHEFLGHSVGQLYDRYVLIGKPGIKNNIRSNCTDNPAGEVFWGVQRAYRGCDSWNLFAPAPLECNPSYLPPAPGGELPPFPPPPGGPPLLNNGNRSTIMSGGECSGPGFDSVEQAWIRTQIIPRYQTTPLVVPPSPSPGASAVTSLANDCNFNLANGQIVRGDVSTQVTAVRANPAYFVSVILLNSRIGTFVGAGAPGNSIVASWNSAALFPNGEATIRCAITPTIGGNTIFSKDVTVNVQN